MYTLCNILEGDVKNKEEDKRREGQCKGQSRATGGRRISRKLQADIFF